MHPSRVMYAVLSLSAALLFLYFFYKSRSRYSAHLLTYGEDVTEPQADHCAEPAVERTVGDSQLLSVVRAADKFAVVVRKPDDPVDWLEDLVVSGVRLALYTFLNDTAASVLVAKYPRCVYLNNTVPNIGQEVPKYVAFLVEAYSSLPNRVAFLHGHSTAWHDPKGKPKSKAVIAAFAKVQDPKRKGIVHLPWFGCANFLVGTGMLTSDWWAAFLGPELGKMPSDIIGVTRYRSPCCQQFVVTKEAIHQHPRSFYKRLYQFGVGDELYGMAPLEKSSDEQTKQADQGKSFNSTHLNSDPHKTDQKKSYIKSQAMERVWTFIFMQCGEGRTKYQCPRLYRPSFLCRQR
eukprot:gnl/MRDRNA2_/MRDRNA2_55355_c0_seq1.p1 gnl/MRDRNA2_/MRDRNA2_55355_c0~~gnl/MRDRNA2_/MRDRNA2_55355_c0_seq1.p1  ORF type:complete len:347 (+),score=36.80 gnl/MRDRNA2_/MRDRNA2_55355_c0_seq1:302-1342(+)